MARMLIVSNRLPITVTRDARGVSVQRSSGGLATGLGAMHEHSQGLWIGWSGLTGEASGAEAEALDARYRELRVVPVALSEDEVERYYEGYCNGLLWPLFHSFLGQLPLDVPDWPSYEATNARFAEAIVAHYREGDLLWVHDYQLMLVPRMVRDRIPNARIGFFLHIPFPSSDTFRTLPSRARLLEGLLGADLLGFHTASYMRNFSSSVLHVLGAATEVDRIRHAGGTTALGVFPMGIDAKQFAALSVSDEVASLVAEFRGPSQETLLVGIDRLDYTKGIPRRLLAYERLLEKHPELLGRVRLVQVAVPSRTNVDAYADFRNQVDALVGRINGRFGSPHWTPVHYVYRGLSVTQVVALYRAADIMLVTPIRDGMNLVAKEFCAARTDGSGVLVLSEFAGAASELGEAIHVNPYDIDDTAAAFHRALSMSEDDRKTRMAVLRQRVFAYDVHQWARKFVDSLEQATSQAKQIELAYTPSAELALLTKSMRQAASLLVFADYDGTLVPLAPLPDLAKPDAALKQLLSRVARLRGVELHVVSGRSRDSLGLWLSDLPIHLHAEHGFWSRRPGEAWTEHQPVANAWRKHALAILRDFADRTPGSIVEEKQSGLAWHYRACDPEYGLVQANELKAHLSALLTNAPVELLSGSKVVELRPHGANKGRIVKEVLAAAPRDAVVVAFGDDVTDEDMFGALPTNALTFRVGPAPTKARFRLHSVSDVLAILGSLEGS
jgi:trehalose 6-phosphate synthase/phosphatase